jgi:hypothetical protein
LTANNSWLSVHRKSNAASCDRRAHPGLRVHNA